jgi:hypothetical protein
MTAAIVHFTIERQGARWAVVDGRRVLRTYSDKTIAQAGALALEQAEERARRGGGRRPCLCCATPFNSDGRQNRLCPDCRDRARRML